MYSVPAHYYYDYYDDSAGNSLLLCEYYVDIIKGGMAVLFSNESEILRKMRLIEWLKAELITHVGHLYQAMAKNSEQAISEGLANIIVACYILARRLGITFDSLDRDVLNKVEQNIKSEHEVEKWFGDFSEYQRHLRPKR